MNLKKKALVRFVFIFLRFFYTLIQPDVMYIFKIYKPVFMIINTKEEKHPDDKEQHIQTGLKQYIFVDLVLGEYKDHSTTKISSFTVYASIQVDGLNPEGADCKISWGENDSYNQFKVYNGGNHLMHSYTSKGRKEVKYEILIPGKSEPIRDSTIEIIGG